MTNQQPTRGRPRHDPGLPRWHGSTLRLRRMEQRISAKALATTLGVSKSTLLRWERSAPGDDPSMKNNPPNQEQVRAIAAFFGCSQISFSKVAKISTR